MGTKLGLHVVESCCWYEAFKVQEPSAVNISVGLSVQCVLKQRAEQCVRIFVAVDATLANSVASGN